MFRGVRKYHRRIWYHSTNVHRKKLYAKGPIVNWLFSPLWLWKARRLKIKNQIILYILIPLYSYIGSTSDFALRYLCIPEETFYNAAFINRKAKKATRQHQKIYNRKFHFSVNYLPMFPQCIWKESWCMTFIFWL